MENAIIPVTGRKLIDSDEEALAIIADELEQLAEEISARRFAGRFARHLFGQLERLGKQRGFLEDVLR